MRLLLVASLLGGCIATRAPRLEERPRWHLQGDGLLETECVAGRAFIRKSGKQGFGVALQLKSRGDCRVSIDTVKLVFPRNTIELPTIAPIELRGRSMIYAWLPVPFDNNAAWNAERNDATLDLGVTAGGRAVAWRIAVQQR